MQPTRREFLALGAWAAAGALLPRRLQAERAAAPAAGAVAGPAPAPAPLSLGYSLYGMKSLPLAAAFAACARIGYGNVELCLAPGFPAEPARFTKAERRAVGRLAGDLGVGISSAMNDLRLFGNPSGHAANLESIKAAAAVLRDTGAEAAAPIESILGGKPADWEREKDRAADRLRQWGDTAGREGVSIVVKGHAASACDDPAKLRWLIERAGGAHLGVNFDQSHYQLAGWSIADSLRALQPWIRLVQVKDAAGTEADPHFLLPGDGQTDFTRYFRLLREAGYRGALVAEVSSQIFSVPGYDPLAAAKRCYDSLAGAAAAANAWRG
jgi:inosose dehydratase